MMTERINDSSLWRTFEDGELTHSAAHYLMAIMHLRRRFGYARVTDVADHLKVSRGAASRATALLKERGWIREDPHRMLELTPDGEELARAVERNFLVIQYFLEDILGLPREVAFEDACKMEHLLSSETTGGLIRLIKVLEKEKGWVETLKARLARTKADEAVFIERS
ncbi:MAG: metal-dependent transcriptional regulator [bacterium]|nr:metal-dependent transcriptional regulator [bacterium]